MSRMAGTQIVATSRFLAGYSSIAPSLDLASGERRLLFHLTHTAVLSVNGKLSQLNILNYIRAIGTKYWAGISFQD